jgi:hypothetical protein
MSEESMDTFPLEFIKEASEALKTAKWCILFICDGEEITRYAAGIDRYEIIGRLVQMQQAYLNDPIEDEEEE